MRPVFPPYSTTSVFSPAAIISSLLLPVVVNTCAHSRKTCDSCTFLRGRDLPIVNRLLVVSLPPIACAKKYVLAHTGPKSILYSFDVPHLGAAFLRTGREKHIPMLEADIEENKNE